MAQAEVIPIAGRFVFEVRFEECPLFRDGPWRGILADGTFEVSYDYRDRDWYISDIAIETDNGKLGKEAQGRTISLHCEEHAHIYAVLLDALGDRYSAFIEEQIAEEIASLGWSVAA